MFYKFLISFLLLFSFITVQASDKVLIPYRSEKLWGFADTSGEIIIKPIYDKVEWFHYEPLLKGKMVYCSFVNKGNDYFFIDAKGKKITPHPDYSSEVQEAYLITSTMSDFKDIFPRGYEYDHSTENYGFINTDKLVLFPFIYEEAYWVQYGYGCFKKDGKMGVVNTKGEVIVPFNYEELTDLIFPPDSLGIIKIIINARDKLARTGLMTVTGKWVIEPTKYNLITVIQESALKTEDGDTLQIIHFRDQKLSTHKYNSRIDTVRFNAYRFLMRVQIDDKTGLLWSDGSWQIGSGIYWIDNYFSKYPYVSVTQNNEYLGWMHISGRKFWK